MTPFFFCVSLTDSDTSPSSRPAPYSSLPHHYPHQPASLYATHTYVDPNREFVQEERREYEYDEDEYVEEEEEQEEELEEEESQRKRNVEAREREEETEENKEQDQTWRQQHRPGQVRAIIHSNNCQNKCTRIGFDW